ncbi:TonB C-terminal domain-containing protein [Paucibacter sp. XJ19-41]|uniref:TonB C-terminal domain-containing protein n=1 Tax=Paucibacter sp. XJ19-41 TaxID=2927824 RepID=UPI0010F96584|nr:TonB C-terminal domain-containing protein [Paucibacter sp. XJ19-41]MDC6170139.1 TonB C-terminal domain-containing protein [Paucibacter sp. XJ19-41]
MSGLAEDHLNDKPGRTWALRAAAALGLLLLAAGVYWLADNLKGGPEKPRRQVAKISILPDTPPPPPPPPKEEKKPEPPKDEPKQLMRDEAPKPQDAPKPADAPLKMEGAAGDGPSAFAAGSVSREYQGGPTGGGPAGGGTVADRAQERLYANSARQLLRDEIERHLRGEGEQMSASFAIWLKPDGVIERFELQPSGDAAADAALQAALSETSRALKLPPPPALRQPMRFRLSVKPQA